MLKFKAIIVLTKPYNGQFYNIIVAKTNVVAAFRRKNYCGGKILGDKEQLKKMQPEISQAATANCIYRAGYYSTIIF